MRDPKRLYKFYNELRDIHIKYFQDWRFGQLIANFKLWLFKKKGKADIFYIEEEEMMSYFKEFVKYFIGDV